MGLITYSNETAACRLLQQLADCKLNKFLYAKCQKNNQNVKSHTAFYVYILLNLRSHTSFFVYILLCPAFEFSLSIFLGK